MLPVDFSNQVVRPNIVVTAILRSPQFALPSLLLVCVCGCGTPMPREYVWKRSAPAAPAFFLVRLSVDPSRNSVMWFEHVHVGDRDLEPQTRTRHDCAFRDDRNWQCKTRGLPDQIEMRDGHLHQQYEDEQRDLYCGGKCSGGTFEASPTKSRSGNRRA